MSFSTSPRLYVVVFIVAFSVVTAMTVVFTRSEVASFRDNHSRIFANDLSKAKVAIETFLSDRVRLVEAFALEKNAQLNDYLDHPHDLRRRAEIGASLLRWFPSHFTFTIADRDGEDLVDDIEGFVGDVCKRGIIAFMSAAAPTAGRPHRYIPIIHPQPHRYHFDLMTELRRDGELRGAFFISFYPTKLVELLRSHESPGNNLVLVNRARPDLIEVVSAGARDAISGTRSIYLDTREKQDVLQSFQIAGSGWNLIAVPDAGFFETAARRQWLAAILIVAAVLGLTTFGLWAVSRIETRRHQAHAALLESRDTLQKQAHDLEQLANRQAALREAAQAAERTKGLFLASMSHEIRTPMTGVLGFSDMLLDDNLPNESREKVEKIKGATKALLTIINDILDMSKIESGKLKIERIDFNLPALIEDVMQFFAERNMTGNGKPFSILVELSDDFPTNVNADPTRIRQVLFNLIGNAVKFTHRGRITVSGTRETNDDGKLMIKISVADTGIGIKPETLENLFSPFTQADASTNRRYEGTGLGLSICKRLVELMGGEIGAASTFGTGSTFWFTLPLTMAASDLSPSVDAAAPTIIHATRPLRLLVAEDNAINQQIIRAVLTRFGHDVTIVGNGVEAVRAVTRGKFDLVVMDVRMPEMSGPDATRAIRALPGKVASIPIVALTADALSEHVDDYRSAGMDAVCAKPIDVSDLAATIDRLLGETIHVSAPAPTELPQILPPTADSHLNIASDSAVSELLGRIDAIARDNTEDDD